MSSGNPTLDAANAETGLVPLNSQPSSPQPPQHAPTVSDPSIDTLPSSLRDLPSPFRPFVLALDTRDARERNIDSVSGDGFPDDNTFSELVRKGLRPEGPSRAESVKVAEIKESAPEGFAKVVKAVEEAGREGDGVRAWKVVTGTGGKAEWYVVGLDLPGERLVGVRFST